MFAERNTVSTKSGKLAKQTDGFLAFSYSDSFCKILSLTSPEGIQLSRHISADRQEHPGKFRTSPGLQSLIIILDDTTVQGKRGQHS